MKRLKIFVSSVQKDLAGAGAGTADGDRFIRKGDFESANTLNGVESITSGSGILF
jgi:hypothetical protein